MRSVFQFLLIVLTTALHIDAAEKGPWRTFTATAYSVEGETASGKPTREGRTVAADPTILPVGTRIVIEGAGPYSGEYVVHDTGPKVRGRSEPIFTPVQPLSLCEAVTMATQGTSRSNWAK